MTITFFISKVTNDLQRIKEEMEEAGQSMTDGCKCLIIIYNFEKLLILFFH